MCGLMETSSFRLFSLQNPESESYSRVCPTQRKGAGLFHLWHWSVTGYELLPGKGGTTPQTSSGDAAPIIQGQSSGEGCGHETFIANAFSS